MELPPSSSSPNPQTLPSPSNWEHDVFLNFRGEDTRNNFTDHLYHALGQRQIKTFRDSENLRRGQSISPESLKAIEKSRFAVIVLSTNYATSTWCLDELAHIVECNKLRGLEVLPVFYHVEPSEIRRQTGNYGEAFVEHEINFEGNITKVDNWREALKKIGTLAGWHVTQDRSESKVIQEIVNQILKVLYVPNRELVGMDVRIKEIESCLDLESNDVLTIGIWGMGGIGKTTLAEELFKKISNQFHPSLCFKSQVRSLTAVKLQQLLCEFFLGTRKINVDTVEKGILYLKKALFNKKVLIVLDDVVCFKQIECLAPEGPLGKNIWGAGSRLIITTRDRSSLMRDPNVQENVLYEIDKLRVYEVRKLGDEEALQLLCQKAFKKKNPPEEFEALSKSFLQYAGGLPLAHEVLGSYLSRVEVDGWSHILRKLDDDLDNAIFVVLEKSFNGLQDTDKKIYLDIACFFNGEDHVRVKNILKGCGFSSGIGINNLINKSLIKVEKNKLWMHDLLRRLGWHIVCRESSLPGERSRLWVDNNALKYESRSSWRFKDAWNVLMDNTGSAAVEGLFLSLPIKEDMSLKDDPFLKMRNLRLLKIYNVNFLSVPFRHISRHLRLLEWHECPLQFLPRNFKSVKLVEIKLPNSRIEELWNEKMCLGMLTLMDLSHCQYLTKTPNFSRIPNLERLILQGCKVLSEVHHTIGNLQKLKFLNLKGCTSLESLPQSISLSSLEIFILSGCSKLQDFPQSVQNMDMLSELYLDGTAIQELPLSMQYLQGLVLLNLNGCSNLLGLPSILCSSLTSLKFLYLSLCSSMVKLPDNIGCLEHLEELDASNTAIRKVPESIFLLKNLKLLCFHGCSGFTGSELLNKFSGLRSLTTLNLGGCNLTEGAIPDDIGDQCGGGLLFSVLYEALKELTIKYLLFKHVLKSVKSTLKSLENVTQEIAKINDDLDRPKEEMAGLKTQLDEGKVLVDKCLKVRAWRVDKTYKYSRKLIDWNDSLKEQFEILRVFAVRDGKETLKTVKGTEKTVNQIESSNVTIKKGVEDLQINNVDLKITVNRVEAITLNIEAALKQPQKEAEIEAWGEVPDLPTLTVGLDVPLNELKMMMFSDEVSMVVLTAPGGCGKTTLATKFCRDKKVQEKFKKNIFFVRVSKTPDFCLIVQELYKSKGNQVPAFKDDENAVKWLQTFVKEQGKDPLLVVLDDVWSGSEHLLHKFDFKMPDHKVLVTSRSEFPGFGSPYNLQSLDFDNAMKLFHHEASLEDRSSHIPPDISRQVVEGCKGFPLAITVAAKSLCGQPVEDWEKRLVDWSKGSSILDSEIQLLLRLQTSLDVLKLVKDCFLDLGSFPEDKRIPVAALIDIWTESYESLDEDILCVANLHQITNRSLANLVVTRKDKLQGDGYYTEHFVTQHDLLRELSIYETKLDDTEQRERLIINISEDNFPKWWREQKYQCMKARLLSISTDGAFSTNWPDMELPEAEVLVLNFQTKNYALPQFVEKMVNLKVLVLTNYGIIRSELTNFQLLCPTSNLKRMRLERISIPSIAKHPIQFSSLQKISLFMCNIGQAFSDKSIQLSHAWPNLVEMNIDYCNDLVALPADTSDLILLKKLSITNNHKLIALPEDIGKLAKLELLRLRSCSGLEELPGSTGNLKKLNFLDISSCFSIKELPENFGELSSLRKLNMRDCSRLKELPLSVSNLEHLQVIGDDDTQSLWQPFLPIEGTHIVLAKENVNLNWLHKYQF